MNNNNKITCLAIDMGASNIRIMLGRVSSSSLELEEIYRFPNRVIDHNGHERWDTEFILKEIIKGINKAVSTGIEISSLGVDSWGVDFALLDANGQLVDLPVAYRDKRTEGMEEKWRGLMSREDTFRRTGINFYIFNTLFQLLSLHGQPELVSASRLFFMPSYILFIFGEALIMKNSLDLRR